VFDVLTTSRCQHVMAVGKYIKANVTAATPRLFDLPLPSETTRDKVLRIFLDSTQKKTFDYHAIDRDYICPDFYSRIFGPSGELAAV
jgi:hypothetical protein